MPRRQRFKPSRKPKPAIEPSEQEQLIGVSRNQEMTPPAREEHHPDEAEDRVPR